MKIEVSHTGKPVEITEYVIDGTHDELFDLINTIEAAAVNGEAVGHLLHEDGPVPLRIRCV